MNIRGENGIINSSGKPGSPSELIDCHEENFLSNIEDGIKSTVISIVSSGFHTLSSCQGHEESCPYRCVSIVDDISVIRALQFMIYTINSSNAFYDPITYYLLPYQKECGLYSGKFRHPAVIDIIFGDCRKTGTIQKQRIFEDFITQNSIEPYNDELPIKYALPYLCQNEHIDVFC